MITLGKIVRKFWENVVFFPTLRKMGTFWEKYKMFPKLFFPVHIYQYVKDDIALTN